MKALIQPLVTKIDTKWNKYVNICGKNKIYDTGIVFLIKSIVLGVGLNLATVF